MSLFIDKEFKEVDFTKESFASGEYDNCHFIACNFDQLHLSNLTFLECNFTSCNLSNTHWGGTTLNDVNFRQCKVLGSNFSVCSTTPNSHP